MIAIVGGGVSGLAAAYELAGRDIPFVLLEASERVGGLVHTERVNGYIIEGGADSMLAQKRTALDLCAELGLSNQLIAAREPRTAFVLHRGRLHRLPSPSVFGLPMTLSGVLGYSLLSPLGRARLALEPVVRRQPTTDESIGAFFRRRFGRQAADRIAQPVLGGIHAGDIDTLSLRTLAPRLAAVEARGSVLRWLRRSVVIDPQGPFRTLASGMGQLVDTIRTTLPPDAVRVNCRVTRLRPGWRLETTQGEVPCNGVIIAAPAYVAAEILADVDPEIAALCAQTAYVSTVAVALAFPRTAIRHRLNGSGFVVARKTNKLRITACTWASSKFDGRAPEGHVLLRAYLGGAHDPDAVNLSDEELVEVSLRNLSRVLSIKGNPEFARVFHWPMAGAQHDVGQAARVAAIQRRLALHHGLFVTGSGFRVTGVPDCIFDGRRTAITAMGQV